MASGDSLQSVAYNFRIGKSTICEIFNETCEILWEILQPIYLPIPDEECWNQCATGFLHRWQLPLCVGAIDGKHVHIKQPNKSGSIYFNYKKTFSIILFGICDAYYKFIYVDIGAYGSQSDGGILRQSSFGQCLSKGTLKLPPNTILPNSDIAFPYYFVGDEAFPLQEHLLKPYSGKFLSDDKQIFNYRLSRARRCIENSFGILAARWRIFHKTIHAFPENAEKIVKATVCLHNYILCVGEGNKYCNEYYDKDKSGSWWNEQVSTNNALGTITGVRRVGTRNAKSDAIQYRDIMKDYLCNVGTVPWQLDHIKST